MFKGMIGVGLIVLVFAGPYFYFVGFGLSVFHSITSPGITIQSSGSGSTVPLNNTP
jgi:hypothetical protein